ncbi:MAG TPA: hemolysin family protein, partial [Candidatus Dojkabacteria bacterium]
GFFSGSETAYFSISEAQIFSLVQKKYKNSKLAQKLKSEPNKLIITILIGNNLVNIGASSVITFLITEKFGSEGVGVATGLMTFLILTFGEIVPKSIGNSFSTAVVLFAAPILYILQIILTPFVIIFENLSKMFIRFLNRNRSKPSNNFETELTALANLSYEKGAIKDYEREVIKKIFKLDDIKAEKIMTPKSKIFMLNGDKTISNVIKNIRSKHFSRIPVYLETEENIIGFLYLRDLIHVSGWTKKSIKEVVREPLFVKPNTPINKVFDKFIETNMHMAFVRSGKKFLGLVTVEDILEELLGEIQDETDPEIKSK